ncbi:MAG: hypothetical protein AB7J13_14395 [Pyrinomonadaceae bacterium]
MSDIKPQVRNKANVCNMLVIMALLIGLTLGCLGPSASDSQCEGTVRSEGRTYTGKARDEEQAGLNACNKYCIEEDGEAKAMIAMWLESDEAKEFERKFKRKPTKEDATIESKTILDYVTQNCAVKCKAQANKGRHTLEASCKN